MDSVRRSARMLVWIALTVALASLLVGCTDPVSGGAKPTGGLTAKFLGLPLVDVQTAIKVGLDAETLDGVNRTNETILAINETLKTGPEIGPETRALVDRLIEQINKANENLRNGIGLNSQTLATLEHAITVLDKGIKVGLDDATLQTIDGVANVIDRQPEKWGEQSRALVEALRLTGKDLAKETADQVTRVIAQTQTSTQKIIASGGEEFRCNADWLGNKVSRSVGEAAGKFMAGFLRSLGKGQKPSVSPAGLCAILPDRLDLVYVDGKLVADKPSSIVTVSGFNFAADNKPRVTVRDEKDAVYSGIDLTSTVEHPYRMTVNLQGKDFSNVTFGAKLVLAWSDEISTTLRNEKAFFIEPLRAPVAKFESSAVSGTVPFAIQFIDRSEGLPEKWFWDFGNGKTSTDREPMTVVYDKPGKYTVQLTVSNRRGKDVRLASEYVTVLVPRAPQVEFRADQREGVAPLTTNFQDQSRATVGDIKDWKWDFGDGATSNERNPKYTYAKPGTYTVRLAVTDQYGTSNSASKTAYVSVKAPPTPTPTPIPLVADFIADRTSGDWPLTVQFTDRSTGNPKGWSWNFGDGGKSESRSPKHTFEKAGTFTVQLTVTNVNGLTKSDSMRIEVKSRFGQLMSGKTVGPFGGPFGGWATEERCPAGNLAFGFNIRVEPWQGNSDDTALNAISLTCGKDGNREKEITSGQMGWGNWLSTKTCPKGQYLTGARMKIEPSIGNRDDTGATNIEFYCGGGSTLSLSHNAEFGAWTTAQYCPTDTAICGIRTKIEQGQGKGDDTALNDARFMCCYSR